MQLRTDLSMPKVTWSESDPVLDEDFPEDDQPGGQDLTRPEPEKPEKPAKPSNATQVQVAQVQAAVHIHQDPAKSNKSDSNATDASAPAPSEGTAEANSSDNSSAVPNDTNITANISGNVTNVSANATTGEENATNATGICATREDDRIKSWFAAAAPPGSACVFGVDVRDENSHCIYEDGAYGSYGWCYTNGDRSEWGACNEHCPLYGAPSALGTKIDSVAKKLDKVVEKLSPGNASKEEEVDGNEANTTAAPLEAEKEAPSEADAGEE
jgi:hypothetical protein